MRGARAINADDMGVEGAQQTRDFPPDGAKADDNGVRLGGRCQLRREAALPDVARLVGENRGDLTLQRQKQRESVGGDGGGVGRAGVADLGARGRAEFRDTIIAGRQELDQSKAWRGSGGFREFLRIEKIGAYEDVGVVQGRDGARRIIGDHEFAPDHRAQALDDRGLAQRCVEHHPHAFHPSLNLFGPSLSRMDRARQCGAVDSGAFNGNDRRNEV